jgi:hypothetical protein
MYPYVAFFFMSVLCPALVPFGHEGGFLFGLLAFLPESVVLLVCATLEQKACHLSMASDSEPQSVSPDRGNGDICSFVVAFHVHY